MRAWAYELRARARGVHGSARVRACGTRVIGRGDVVVRWRDGRAHWRGVARCQRATCPVCALARAARRAERVAALVAAASPGHRWRMVTLTLPHARGEQLRDVLDRLVSNYRRWRSHRRVRAVMDQHVRATVRAVEVTRSPAAGWHPHIHVLWLVNSLDSKHIAALEEEWCRLTGALLGVGCVVSDERAVSEYVAKLGAEAAGAEAAGIAKLGRRRSHGMWQLLDMASSGVQWAREAWRELELALHGRRLFELDERAKRLVAAQTIAPMQHVDVWVTREEYRVVARAERAGVLGALEAPLLVVERAVAAAVDPQRALDAWMAWVLEAAATSEPLDGWSDAVTLARAGPLPGHVSADVASDSCVFA